MVNPLLGFNLHHAAQLSTTRPSHLTMGNCRSLSQFRRIITGQEQEKRKKYLTKCNVYFTLILMELVNHIRQYRAWIKITQEELARCVEVSRQTIISIEKGRYVPSALLAFKIARILGVPADTLFELVEGSDHGKK
jgi:putative transcriptional regulator